MVFMAQKKGVKVKKNVKAGRAGKAAARDNGKFMPFIMLALLMGSALTMAINYDMNYSNREGQHFPPVQNTATDLSALDNETLANWMEYEGSVDDSPVVTIDPGIARATPGQELTRIAEEEGRQNFSDPNAITTGPSYYGSGMMDGRVKETTAAGAGVPAAPSKSNALDVARSSSNTQVQRVIEEADLIKVIGTKLYVLNQYRGLIIIDVSDPVNVHVEGQVPVAGYPEEMYVVDFLAIITVNTNYRFWYNYWLEDSSKEGTGTIGTIIYIVSVKDPAHPKIFKMVEVQGFPGESRRVGHVIYQTTNVYNWDNYYGYSAKMAAGSGSSETPEPYTIVTSIDFGSPKTLGMKDRVKFSGESNQVHASQTAFYITQTKYTERPEWLGWFYAITGESSTSEYVKVTYLDIRDPNGRMIVRDSINAPGYIYDKYQMDEYNGMLRIVTHDWSERNTHSWLFIYDVSDPNDIVPLGKLMIDDTGSLMATRFAGERAYTIHLPQSVDPLDVLDLSDPKNPKLCDVFEMPGWVTHMDVIGYYILALGVDNSEGEWNVAVSLFDVKDPYNAVMLDRVRIGDQYATSSANWEPKALTVDKNRQMLVVPFESYSWGHNNYNYEAGFQIVSYDLEKGDLEIRGEVLGSSAIERTRVIGDYIMAISYRYLQSVDITDLDEPVVLKVLDLTLNVIDVAQAGDYYLQVATEGILGTMTVRSVRGVNDLAPVDSVSINASWGRLFQTPSGMVLVADVSDGYNTTGTLYAVQVQADGRVVVKQIGALPVNMRFTYYDYYYDYYNGDCCWRGDFAYYSYMNEYYAGLTEQRFVVAGNNLVYIYTNSSAHSHQYDWGYNEKTGNYEPMVHEATADTLYMFDLSNIATGAVLRTLDVDTYTFVGLMALGSKVYVQHQMHDVTVKEYTNGRASDVTYEYKNYVIEIDLDTDCGPGKVAEYNVPGKLIGIEEGRFITVKAPYYSDEHASLNVLEVSGGVATSVFVMDIGAAGTNVVYEDGKAYVMTTTWPDYEEMEKGETVKTELRIIEVQRAFCPTLVASMAFDGYVSLMDVVGGHMLVSDGYGNYMMVYSVEGGSAPVFEDMVRVMVYPEDINIADGTLYLMQGYYPIVEVAL